MEGSRRTACHGTAPGVQSRLGGTMEGSCPMEGPLAMAPLPGPRIAWEGPWRDPAPWAPVLVCGCVVLGVHAHRRLHVLPSWSDGLLFGGLSWHSVKRGTYSDLPARSPPRSRLRVRARTHRRWAGLKWALRSPK